MKPKVLIIEDEKNILDEIESILSFEGFDVETAASGLQGIHLTQKAAPDLILCDIAMPGMNGFELLDELRQNDLTAMIPFIFLTAKAEQRDVRKGMGLGADDYLLKPVAAEDLLESINTRLEKSKRSKKQMELLRENIVNHLPHEFNTPLAGIIGFAQILKESFDSLSRDEALGMADSIHASGKRLQKLISKYLHYTKLQIRALQKGEKTETIKYLSHLIYNISQKVSAQYKREQDICLDKLGEFEIHFPYHTLGLVLEEILENAFKFSQPGNKVLISTAPEKRQLTIRDYGIGFNPADIPKIGAYMQFNRGKMEQQGSGFGLILAKKAMEIYGKSLGIYPEKKGTSVVLQF